MSTIILSGDFSTSIPPDFTLDTTNAIQWTDHESPPITRTAAAGVAAFTGTRMVENLLSDPLDLASASWTRTNITVGAKSADPLGGNRAQRITATAADATITQSVAVTSGDGVTNTAWIKRITGTGAVSVHDGEEWEDISALIDASPAPGWVRCCGGENIARSGDTNRTCGVKLATSGDAIDMFGPQVENVTAQTDKTAGEVVVS